MSIDLHFYVAGVPAYKMQSYIYEFIEQYENFVSQLQKEAQNFTKKMGEFSMSQEFIASQ